MPNTTQAAIDWALLQTWTDVGGQEHLITAEDHHLLVEKVREYFNANGIAYSGFSYTDLVPFLQ